MEPPPPARRWDQRPAPATRPTRDSFTAQHPTHHSSHPLRPLLQCVMDVGGTQQSFDICYAVEGIGNGFNLGWTLLPGNTALRMGVNSSAHGYVSFGFPPNPEPDTGEYGSAVWAG